MNHIFTTVKRQACRPVLRLIAFLLLLLNSGLSYLAQAQSPSFTAAQIEQGTDCNWPYNAVATNPADGKIYGFWRKGAGATATYKLIRWEGSSWSTVSTFTTSTGTGSTTKVPNFDGASDDVGLAIDATGKFHVVFQGYRGSGLTSTRGVWYGLSTNGTSWSFTEIQTFTDPSGFKNTNSPIIEVDGNNQPHIGFIATDANDPRFYTLRYYHIVNNAFTGENAFTQSGGSPAINEINTLDLAIDNNAKAHIAFQRETSGQGRDGGLWYTTNSSGTWSTPIELAKGLQDKEQGQTIGIDIDAANKVNIVYSDYQHKLYYLTNASGSFSGGQINGNLTGDVPLHGFHIRSDGTKFFSYYDAGLKYAYQTGQTGANGWTTGTAYTPPSGNDAVNYFSGILNTDGRIMLLFDNLSTSNGNCGSSNPRNLWYATATIASSTPPPAFTQQPTSTAVCSGNTATFSATASNTTGFQWQQSNTADFANPTSLPVGSTIIIYGNADSRTSTLTFTTSSSLNGQYFRAVVTGAGGTTNSNAAQLTVNPLPTQFNVTGGGAYCAGGSGVVVGLSGSQTGVNYQLRRDGNAVGSAVAGTGSALNFGNQTTAGTYTVQATNASTTCQQTMSGSAAVSINALPTQFNVTGGGAYCAGGSGVAVGLSGSQTGVNYQLLRDGNAVGSSVAGTGSALSFGNQTTGGTYTVQATNASTSCQQTMSGSAAVSVNALPTQFNMTGGGAYCAGGSGVVVGLSGSQTGVNYQLRRDGNAVGSSVAGTGSALNFGNQTTAGTYTVQATNASTSCQQTMSGSAIVTVNPLPTQFNVTGGGAYCQGGSGVAVGLSGSQTGVNYQLRRDGNAVGSAVAGTGSALNFGNQTTAGTYTVQATNASTSCQQAMSGSVAVTINPLPNVSITGVASAYCKDASPVQLADKGNPPGGSFTIDGTPATQFAPMNLTVGDHNLMYRYTDGNSCTNTTSLTVTVKEVPTPPTLVTANNQPYPAGVSSLTVSQNTGPVILMVSGCANGTITWDGGNSTTLGVSTSNLGTQTFMATCTRNGCTSPAAVASVTVQPTTLGVLHRDASYGQTQDNTITPYLELSNAGNDAIPYGEITVRYWFTSEGVAPPTNLTVYYAQLGAVQMSYVPLSQPRQGANGYVEYSFSGGGSLPGQGNSGPIENGIQKTDGSNFNETDDYSYMANYADYVPNAHITAYRNGVIFWGQEPTTVASQTAVQVYSAAIDQPVASQIQTRVELRNTGNVALPVANLKLRYYFTSDNGQLASVYVDYADIGAQNVAAQVIKLGSPVNGADSYVELSFPGSSLTLNPLSSLGYIDFRLVRSDNGLFDQTNDYSYAPNYGNVGLNNHITAYLNNSRVFGNEPTGSPRVAASEPVSALSVRVLGNPVMGSQAQVEIRGAEGQAVSLKLIDLQGKAIHEQRIEQAAAVEPVNVPLGQSSGTMLLRVSTTTQQQVLKLLRP